MGSYSVEWKSSALRELKKLPRDVVPRILSAVEDLASDPYPAGTRKLAGAEHSYRIRIGDYRILYNIWDSRLVIEIIRVGNRRDVYDR